MRWAIYLLYIASSANTGHAGHSDGTLHAADKKKEQAQQETELVHILDKGQEEILYFLMKSEHHSRRRFWRFSPHGAPVIRR